MTTAQPGNKVRVHYTGRTENGEVFDSSEGRDPLEFTLGEGRVIPGFEKGLEGMNVGESRTIKVPEADGYGPVRDDLVFRFPKERLPEDLEPKIGEYLEMRDAAGQAARVKVVEVAEEEITLDANHPLAGQNLEFEVELVEVA